MFNCKTLVSVILTGAMALGAHGAVLDTNELGTVHAVITNYNADANCVMMVDENGDTWEFQDCQIEMDFNDSYEIAFLEGSYEPVQLANLMDGTTWTMMER